MTVRLFVALARQSLNRRNPYLQAARIRLPRLRLGLQHSRLNDIQGRPAQDDYDSDPCCNFLSLVGLVFGVMKVLQTSHLSS